MFDLEESMIPYKYDKLMKTRELVNDIPWLKFPDEWIVKIIPPFAGASIRFSIKTQNTNRERVSVYLDCFDKLGCMGEPYWEIHRLGENENDEWPRRCLMNETDELISIIKEALDSLEKSFGKNRDCS